MDSFEGRTMHTRVTMIKYIPYVDALSKKMDSTNIWQMHNLMYTTLISSFSISILWALQMLMFVLMR